MDLNYINIMATGLMIEVEHVIHPSVSSIAILGHHVLSQKLIKVPQIDHKMLLVTTALHYR